MVGLIPSSPVHFLSILDIQADGETEFAQEEEGKEGEKVEMKGRDRQTSLVQLPTPPDSNCTQCIYIYIA